MKQLTFEDYLKEKNKEYASKCRHCLMDHCYLYTPLKPIEDVQCPCEDFEIRQKCSGCIHDKPKCYSRECFSCKRYNFMPTVRTKNLEDKYET